MTYRTIIVELQPDRFPAARLTAARALAQRFGAALVGMHVMPPPYVPVLWEGGGAVSISARRSSRHKPRPSRKPNNA